jgi:hypothetical protein
LSGRQQGHRADAFRPHNLGGGAVLVEQHGKWHRLVLDEGLCVPFATRADSDDPCPGCQDLVVSLADLTGPFATGDSAKVAKKENQVGLVRPHIT